MIAQEGRVDIIRICAAISSVGLFQRCRIGADHSGIPRALQHLGDLAIAVGKGKVEDTGNTAGIVLGDRLEVLPNLRHQIAVRLQFHSRLLEPVQHLHVLTDTAGIELLGCIQTEAGDAFFKPELHNILDLFPDSFAFQIQIRHCVVENALIVPVGTLHRSGTVAGGLFGEEIIIQVLTFLCAGFRALGQILQIGHRFLEPGVL